MNGATEILPRIGFALRLTALPGPSGPPREAVVADGGMSSRTVEDAGGGAVRIVWRGHPLCGAAFSVAAELAPAPDGVGWDYSFRYDGNASGLAVEAVEFPVLTVPRTDATEIFYPWLCGRVRRPKWSALEPGAVIAETHATGLHFLAALNGADESWYVDQRGDARLRPNWAVVRNGSQPGTVALVFRHLPEVTEANRVAGALPFGGRIATFRGDWFAAAEIYRRWAWEQPWAKAAFARPRNRLRDIAI